MKKSLLLPVAVALASKTASAHCPLCTIGAAAAAGGAAWMGVSNAAIGVFIGGFAVSIGWWISKVIKQYVPYQTTLLVLFSFGTTVFPMLPLFTGVQPLYISIAGELGSLLNRTYIINMFLIGSITGGIIIAVAPTLSQKITELRGKQMAYQGMALTFSLLIISSALFQWVI